jgi:NitT/TauT family transport system permease protein
MAAGNARAMTTSTATAASGGADRVRRPAPAPAPGRKRLARPGLKRGMPIILPVLTTIVMLSIWEAAVRILAVSPVTLPAPSAIFHSLVYNFPLLLHHTAQTTSEAAMGLALAIAFGVSTGMALAYSPIFRAAVYPHMVFFQLVPKVALAPLFIMWLGIGSESRLAFCVFIAFFPILVSTASGLASVEHRYIRFCRALTATEWQTFMHVRLPFALPYIFSGMKIGVTMSFIGIIVGEFITSQAGLGYLILFASTRAETAVIFAAVFMLCVVGLSFYGALAWCEKIMLRRYGAQYAG